MIADPQRPAVADPDKQSWRAIDADTHVDENDATWSYLQPTEQRYKPVYIHVPGHEHGLWIYDGMQRNRTIRSNQKDGTTAETRELIDVPARLRDMDRMAVETQVIFPTFFAQPITERPEVELALRRSYNRWLAERCATSNGRLRWIMCPPLMSMDKAIEEIRWAKDHGACGILKKGDKEAGFWPSEEYFFPLYQEAQKLDIAIAIHIGSGRFDGHTSAGAAYTGGTPVIHAFNSLITRGVPPKFPNLRWGFIEAYASWVPYVLYNVKHIVDTLKERPNVGGHGSITDGLSASGNLLAQYNFYVSCQVDEDLPYLLKHAGEDNLLIGSDYTHNDFSSQITFSTGLQQRADNGEIPQSVVRKIMYDNPRRLYGL